MKKTILALIAFMLIGGFFLTNMLWARQETYSLIRIFNRILKEVEDNYVVKPATDSLLNGAIEGMLETLNDPHTVYLSREEFERLRVSTEGEFGGIGATIGTRNDSINIVSPLEGTPAQKAGLQPGDIVLMVDSVATQGKNVDMVVKEIRGEPGTTVVLTILRTGLTEPFSVTITRAVIKLEAVPFYTIVTDDIGYVYLASFSRTADAELRRALDSLFARGAKKIIFDLRLNSGGLLQEGIAVGELFLDKGREIVATRGRSSPPTVYRSTRNPSFGEFPMITLVDIGSASASEIVAGALQDWDRSLIMGTNTFGKGSVQNIIPLDEGALKMTTARWYTPAGRGIDKPPDRQGIEDDTLSSPTGADAGKSFTTLGPLKRTVFGDGGIGPDIPVRSARLRRLDSEVILKGYFFDFVVKYTAAHKDIDRSFRVGPPVLDEFARYLRGRKMEFTDAQFDSSRAYFTQRLHHDIAANLWGVKEGYRINLGYDSLVIKATALLKEVKSQKDLFRHAR